jgi:hypothetical protein
MIDSLKLDKIVLIADCGFKGIFSLFIPSISTETSFSYISFNQLSSISNSN